MQKWFLLVHLSNIRFIISIKQLGKTISNFPLGKFEQSQPRRMIHFVSVLVSPPLLKIEGVNDYSRFKD